MIRTFSAVAVALVLSSPAFAQIAPGQANFTLDASGNWVMQKTEAGKPVDYKLNSAEHWVKQNGQASDQKAGEAQKDAQDPNKKPANQ
jgi:hypothetical protein